MNYALCEEEFRGGEAGDIKNEMFWQKLGGILGTTLEMVKETAEEMGIDLNSVDVETSEEDELVREAANEHVICCAAKRYADNVKAWFDTSGQIFERAGESLTSRIMMGIAGDYPEDDMKKLEDVVAVVRWYQYQIYVKLVRAVRGLVEKQRKSYGYAMGDAEGSAKVGLIGMDRSIEAWGQLMALLPEQEDAILNILVELKQLRRMTEETIPGARDFVRPGLDEI